MPTQGSQSYRAQVGMLRALERARPVPRGLGPLAEPAYRRVARAVWQELLPAEVGRLLEPIGNLEKIFHPKHYLILQVSRSQSYKKKLFIPEFP